MLVPLTQATKGVLSRPLNHRNPFLY